MCLNVRVMLSTQLILGARYNIALEEQPKSQVLHYGEFKLVSAILFLVGSTLVVTSMWKLGITGTYLGARQAVPLLDQY